MSNENIIRLDHMRTSKRVTNVGPKHACVCIG